MGVTDADYLQKANDKSAVLGRNISLSQGEVEIITFSTMLAYLRMRSLDGFS
jgi:hypothetical protein